MGNYQKLKGDPVSWSYIPKEPSLVLHLKEQMIYYLSKRLLLTFATKY